MIRKEKRRFLRFSKIIFLPLTVLFILIILLAARSSFFRIKQIEIQGDKIGCASSNQLKNESGLYGQNFFLVNLENIAKSLKDKFFCIRDINLSYVFPSKVQLKISARQPVAALVLLKDKEATISSVLENFATPSAEEFLDAYLVDNEGVIFSKNTGDLAIPNIFVYDSNFSLGKKAGSKAENSLQILDKVKTFGLDIKTSTVLDNFFVIFSYPKLVFRLDNAVETQVASLQLILTDAKIDLKELEFIDLRFDKPIVRTCSQCDLKK